MKAIRISFSIIALILLAVISVPVYADEERISAADVSQTRSDYCRLMDEEVMDSYGNKYSSETFKFYGYPNILAEVIYDLDGEFDTFSGAFAVSDDTVTGSTIDIGIFADGKLIYGITGMTRQDSKQEFAVNVRGTRKLEVKVDGCFLYMTDAQFVRTDDTSVLLAESYAINNTYVIDSKQYDTYNRMFCDSFGNLHCRYARFITSGWFNSRDSYAMFNLKREYYHFEGAFVASNDTSSDAVFSIKILCDGNLVYERSNITKTTPVEHFSVDVKDIDTLKIETNRDEVSYSGSLYLVDDFLYKHQHEPGEQEVLKEATCTEAGEEVCRCTICGSEMKTTAIPALGHNRTNEWVMLKEASCTEEGREVQYCSVCNEAIESRDINKLPHTVSEDWEMVSEPTCGKEGMRRKVCTICGEVLEEEKLDKTRHMFGTWSVISGSIWKNPIIKKRTCSVCGEVGYLESNPTRWLAPLIAVILILMALTGITLILFSVYNLPIKPESLKTLISRLLKR